MTSSAANAVYSVPKGWQLCTAGEIRSPEPNSCVAGPFGSKISSKYFVDDGVPVIRGCNLRDDLTRFVPDGFVFVSEARAQEYRPQHVRSGDLVFTCWGTIGQVGLVPDDGPYPEYIISNKQLKLRVDRNIADPRFCFYYFASPRYADHIRNRGIGGAVPGINLGILKSLAIALPPIDAQRRIVDILSAYDDLIENNRRRMALLEEAARQLYREWFVRLRFPGHEHTRITKGVPEEWERRRIGDVADCVGGGTPSTSISSYWEGGDVMWVTPTDVTRNRHFVLLDSEKNITEAGLQNSSAKLVPPHAVLMTSRASVGFFALAGKEVCTNQGFISIVANDAILSPYFLFHLSERVEEIRAMGSGSTYPEVSRGKFRELEVLLPKYSLATAFCEYVNELLKQIRVLKQQNEKLRAARDLLLPRLMSGEIAV